MEKMCCLSGVAWCVHVFTPSFFALGQLETQYNFAVCYCYYYYCFRNVHVLWHNTRFVYKQSTREFPFKIPHSRQALVDIGGGCRNKWEIIPKTWWEIGPQKGGRWNVETLLHTPCKLNVDPKKVRDRKLKPLPNPSISA